MTRSWNPLGSLARRANDAFLAPFVIIPNMGFAALNATLGTAAKMAEVSAYAVGSAGFGPLAPFVQGFTGRVAHHTLEAAREAGQLAVDGGLTALGRGAGYMNPLLATTILKEGFIAATFPLQVGLDAASAAFDVEAVQQAAAEVGFAVSRMLDSFSTPGVIPGDIGAKTNAQVRWGFYEITTRGPLRAVGQDITGVGGGLLALGIGDFAWLAYGMRRFFKSMEYVYEKKQHGKTQPDWDFPIDKSLADQSVIVIEHFPERFVQALETGNPLEVFAAYMRDMNTVNAVVGAWARAQIRVADNTRIFSQIAMFDVPDAQNYALCANAIMESNLSNKEKDAALFALRKTAPKTEVTFGDYTPLMIPIGGTVKDKPQARNAAGEIIDDHVEHESVFEQLAIDIAQAINSELYTLRSLLWLYRDEAIAWERAFQETVRKFGLGPAQRIADHLRYPLTPEEVTELTRSGPRPPTEIAEIIDGLLCQRGLDAIAAKIRDR
jgi:hypothetical protein